MDNETPQTPPTEPTPQPSAAAPPPAPEPAKPGPKAAPKRIFVYDGKDYPDIDPKKTPDEIRQAMADFYPELSNADVNKSKRGDDEVYELRKRTGTKGS